MMRIPNRANPLSTSRERMRLVVGCIVGIVCFLVVSNSSLERCINKLTNLFIHHSFSFLLFSKFSTVHFLKTLENTAFGGRMKGFGDRKTYFRLSENKFFCPQKTIFRHVAKRSDGFFKKCTVEKWKKESIEKPKCITYFFVNTKGVTSPNTSDNP